MSDLAGLVALLDDIECHSYTLHATDKGFWTRRTPDAAPGGRLDLRLTIVGRIDFEQVCTALGVSPKERVVHAGQRAWWAEADTKDRKLLVEGVSFQHHDDWEAR